MRIIIITGQTATGKTDFAFKLAKQYDGELINCDSRQVYKKLDIVTGKDLPENSKVWLYDIVDPKQYFSSYDFVSHLLPVIKKILSKGKTPVIVGGAYFYLYHLLYYVETEHIKPDWKLRKKLNNKSVQELQKIFRSLDSQSFKRLNNSDKHNPQRLIRKIEILTNNTRAKIDSFHIPDTVLLSKKLELPVQIEYIGLRYKNTQELADKIRKRVEKRMKSGAIKEVSRLLKQGYSENDPGLKTIGYPQIIAYLKGQISKKETVEEWISKEIQYAKRQYTFMKKDPHISWKSV